MNTLAVPHAVAMPAVSFRPPDSPVVAALRKLFHSCDKARLPRPSRFVDVLTGKKPEGSIKVAMLDDAVRAAGGNAMYAIEVCVLLCLPWRARLAKRVPPLAVLMRRETEVEGRCNVAQVAWLTRPSRETFHEFRSVFREYALVMDLIEIRCELDAQAQQGAA